MVSGPTFCSVLTATVLPSRPLGDVIELPFLTSTASQACLGLLPPSTPWEMICRGRPLELAMINEVVLENPIWSEPESTAGTIASPPGGCSPEAGVYTSDNLVFRGGVSRFGLGANRSALRTTDTEGL